MLFDKQIQSVDDGPVRFSFGGLGTASASNYGKVAGKLEGEQRTTDLRTLQSRIIGVVGGGTAMASAVRGISMGRGWVVPGVLFFGGAYYILEGFRQ